MRIVVSTLQPTRVSTLAWSDDLKRTEAYIPGWVVRGAFAGAWLARNTPLVGGRRDLKDQALRERFIAAFEGGLSFGPLFRGGPPVSLSVYGHKYRPRPECVDRVDAALQPNLQAPDCTNKRCRQPRASQRGLDEGERPNRRTRTSVDIGDDGVARKGLLFRQTSLEADQRLAGEVTGTAEALAELSGLTIHIGGRRGTQGLAHVAFEPSTQPQAELTPDNTLILRLVSPGIFVDDSGRPIDRPNVRRLSAALGTEVAIVKAWTRWERVGGWHLASGLPKHTEVAVSAGSTYAIRAREGSETIDGEVAGLLLASGIGLRTFEGFGHLRQAPPATEGGMHEHLDVPHL